MHSERYSCRWARLLCAAVTDELGPTCQGQSMAASSYLLPASAVATPVQYDCYFLRTQQAFRRDHNETAAVPHRTAALRDAQKFLSAVLKVLLSVPIPLAYQLLGFRQPTCLGVVADEGAAVDPFCPKSQMMKAMWCRRLS
jgi:hypothetical protein